MSEPPLDESRSLSRPGGQTDPAQPDTPDVIPPHIRSRRSTRVLAYYFSGPLPDPETLAEYEKVLEGAAKEIFQMAKEEAAFQRDYERRALDAEIKAGAEGTRLAALVAVAGFAMTAFIAYVGGAAAAAVVGTVGIGGIVHIVATGRKTAAKEANQEKLPAQRDDDDET